MVQIASPAQSMATTLVYHGGALGDFITTLPALRAWKASFPAQSMALLSRDSARQAAELTNLFNEYWNVESKSFLPLFAEGISVEGAFSDVGSPAALPRFASLQTAILFSKPGSTLADKLQRCGVLLILSQHPFPTSRMHKFHYHLEFLKRHLVDNPLKWQEPQQTQPLLQPPSKPPDNELGTIWKEVVGSCEGISAQPSRRVIIHPGSGSATKNWPLERFLLLAEKLRRNGCSVLWMAGPAEEGLEIPDSFAQVRNRSIADLVYLVGQCDLYIGNDSGISHCAAATNSSCILIYGPSDPVVWRPYGTGVRILHKPFDCSPCHRVPNDPINAARPKESDCGRRCLSAITVDEVYQACTEAFNLYKGEFLR